MTTKRQFTHPNLLTFSARTIGFEEPDIEEKIPDSLKFNPDRAIDLLVQGNHKFVERRTKGIEYASVRLSAVAQGQKPFAAVLNYAKLSNSTEEIFNQKFGDLFVINAPGHTTNYQDISSIEYGVLMLGIKTVVILGDANSSHESHEDSQMLPECGDVTYNVNNFKLAIKNNKILLSSPKPSNAKTNILSQVAKLNGSPLLRQFIHTGELKIIGGLYDDKTGLITILEQQEANSQ